MLIRNYSTSQGFVKTFVPLFARLFWRALGSTHVRAQWAMVRIMARRALVWLPFQISGLFRGTKMPVTLQLVDDVSCRAACSHCVFTTFKMKRDRLSLGDLDRIFREALSMNITNVYLMGADPFYRENAAEFIALLARHKYQFFFLCTEGKKLSLEHVEAIRRAGNIIPVLNIDGLAQASDARKGEGTFDVLEVLLAHLKTRRMPFFVSTMVSRANYSEVTGTTFIRWLDDRGAWILAYVPYTPVDARAEADLVMDATTREKLFEESLQLNQHTRRLVVLDLLGIEQKLTSCPSAVYTMTIFHDGTVTPCPAVPFGHAEDSIHRRSLSDLFFHGHLYGAIRAKRREGSVHCMFYGDPRFLLGYIRKNRESLRILNPSSIRHLEEREGLVAEEVP